MNLPPCATLTEPYHNFKILEIKHATANAKIAIQGAHIIDWQPSGHSPILYLSPQAHFTKNKAIRGGIPICSPWFNAHPSEPELPAHGLMRQQDWNLLRVDETTDYVDILFQIQLNPISHQWEHSLLAHLAIRLSSELEITLHTENTGHSPFTLSEALHTYLEILDIHQVSISGLQNTPYLNTVGTPTELIDEEPSLCFDQEIDRIYHSTSGVILRDPALKREIIIDKLGSNSTVIWNPWIEKSKRLTDLPDDGYQQFVCIESANAASGSIALAPQHSHTISTRIGVKPI
jgi:glucose-6-phosphate 1-epimerase